MVLRQLLSCQRVEMNPSPIVRRCCFACQDAKLESRATRRPQESSSEDRVYWYFAIESGTSQRERVTLGTTRSNDVHVITHNQSSKNISCHHKSHVPRPPGNRSPPSSSDG